MLVSFGGDGEAGVRRPLSFEVDRRFGACCCWDRGVTTCTLQTCYNIESHVELISREPRPTKCVLSGYQASPALY